MRDDAHLRWRQAQEDAVTAEYNARGGRYYAAVYFAHQAAEKAFKALVIDAERQVPPREHNLRALAARLGAPPEVVAAAEALAPHYVASRYPDAVAAVPAEIYGEEGTWELVRRAREVVAWIGSRLSS